ncbi:MAG TPA: acyl-CoA dehydrogenase family protein [Nevskiaceae bacterium]|nr:acyl-CoA dehydrogenase family protein [Nevskiaceae bacterium]
MDLLPTDDQQQIVAAIRDVLADGYGSEALRRNGGTITSVQWQALADLGWLGLALPESRGGSGLTIVEEALLCRELGRALMPPALIATLLAAHVVHDPALLDGRTRVAFVAGDYVVDDREATLALEIGDAQLRLVRLPGARAPLEALDESLGLSSVAAAQCEVVGRLGADAVLRAHVLLAATLTGVAEGACALSVEHAKTREQFGQPIGAFQAIKHACADMAIRCEAAWFQVAFASLAVRDASADAAAQAAAALRCAQRAAIDNAEAGVQVHGAMGFSSEADPHRFVKRAQVLSRLGPSSRRLDDLLLGTAA